MVSRAVQFRFTLVLTYSNSLKPILTEENKLARLLMVNHFRDPQDPSKYQDMRDHIHLD